MKKGDQRADREVEEGMMEGTAQLRNLKRQNSAEKDQCKGRKERSFVVDWQKLQLI